MQFTNPCRHDLSLLEPSTAVPVILQTPGIFLHMGVVSKNPSKEAATGMLE